MPAVRTFRGGATVRNNTWKRSGGTARMSAAGGAAAPGFGQWKTTSGGSRGRQGSNLKTTYAAFDVAPLKGSTGGAQTSGRKIRS